jgi:hypothetical protein
MRPGNRHPFEIQDCTGECRLCKQASGCEEKTKERKEVKDAEEGTEHKDTHEEESIRGPVIGSGKRVGATPRLRAVACKGRELRMTISSRRTQDPTCGAARASHRIMVNWGAMWKS